MNPLGRLERVDLRLAWVSEPQDFTPWLAREENLKLISEALGMDLELEAQEKGVGPFRADLLCRNTDDDTLVLIENQLEVTDHGHLGQLMTYAAGLDAVNIVWIAAVFSEQHRAALDWLNEITGDRFRFFGLEVELWRIGDSPAAPKFNVISKPNDWAQSVSRLGDGEVSETKATYLRFWSGLKGYLEIAASPLRVQTPQAQHWYNFGIGRSGYKLVTTASVVKKWLAVELYIRNDPNGACVRQLLEDREAIEALIGAPLDWRELPGRIASRVLLKREGDPADETKWPEQFAWFDKTLRGFNAAFRDRVRELDPGALDPAAEASDEEPVL